MPEQSNSLTTEPIQWHNSYTFYDGIIHIAQDTENLSTNYS